MDGVPHPPLRSAVPFVCGVGQVNFESITSAVWQLATRCLILWYVFGIKLSNEDIAVIEGLRDVAMATNFGTTIAVTGFV